MDSEKVFTFEPIECYFGNEDWKTYVVKVGINDEKYPLNTVDVSFRELIFQSKENEYQLDFPNPSHKESYFYQAGWLHLSIKEYREKLIEALRAEYC